jgi:DNA-binding CsgD family transcriptional regulator
VGELDHEVVPALDRLLARVEDGPFRDEGVSEAIQASWHRDAASGLQPHLIHAPYDAEVDVDCKLHWAAAPAMAAVSADLPESRCALLLTDHRVQVIDRWTRTTDTAIKMDAVGAAPGFFCDEATVGTNSIGMAASTRGTALVRGFEHYADAFTLITCASRAVVDPLTGQVLGVVNMTVADPSPWELMAALVGRVVHETQQRLLDDVRTRSVIPSQQHPGLARLTDAERSVAEVVAAGYTNREAAAKLFVSPHTVDYHLRHIFGKLDIESRVQLARIVENSRDLHASSRLRRS